MADVSLVVTPRGGFGKGPARQLRRSGLVPAVFYGDGVGAEGKAIAVPLAPLSLALIKPMAILEVQVDGRNIKAAPRDVQRHPVSHEVEHLEIVELSESQVREREAAAVAAIEAEVEAARLSAIESRRLAAIAAETEAKEAAAAAAAAAAAPVAGATESAATESAAGEGGSD